MKTRLAIAAGGVLFGFGLGLCNLLEQEVVLSFLQLSDLGLALTMAAAIATTMPAYRYCARRMPEPFFGGSFETFPLGIRKHHVVGGVLFGIGWGISGICPGAALASLGAGSRPMFAGLGGMLLGAYLQGVLADK